MYLKAECMACQLKEEMGRLGQIKGADRKIAFVREVCAAIEKADATMAISVVRPVLDEIDRRYGIERIDYRPLKKRYNDMILSLLPDLEARVAAAADPLGEAIRLSRCGNYIDFSAFKEIDNDRLMALLDQAGGETLDEEEYGCLVRDLEQARRLTYVVDNCGEIVLDMLVLAQLRKRYPAMDVTILVRGAEVFNDATIQDALYVGMDRYGRIVDNGTNIAGTQLQVISPQARDTLKNSDVIIAKGMGNFETMCGCGLNVYYLFLCKCDYFAGRLGVPMMTGMLVNDLRLRAISV